MIEALPLCHSAVIGFPVRLIIPDNAIARINLGWYLEFSREVSIAGLHADDYVGISRLRSKRSLSGNRRPAISAAIPAEISSIIKVACLASFRSGMRKAYRMIG